MKTPESDVKRILVVEDEPAICKLCQKILLREGFKVDIAVNGEVAHDMLEKQQYDLFLFDIKLPVMSGKELYKWLLKNNAQLASRVIFTSGSMATGDTQSFLEQVARPFLPKPFIAAELIAIVRQILEENER